MGDKCILVESNKIKEIFHTMEYGNAKRTFSLAKSWFEKQKGTIKSITSSPCEHVNKEIHSSVNESDILVVIEEATGKLDSCKNFKATLKITEVAFNLLQLANEIDQNINVICEIEMLARNILPRDTKKSVLLLSNYLRHYSGWVQPVDGDCYHILKKDIDNLGLFGGVLAGALASSRHLQIEAEGRIFIVLSFIIQKAISIGFPEEQFTLVSRQLDSGKTGGIPMLVFNNADLDSACESTIHAAWDHNGTLPWSVDTILIQEDIFKVFVDKLKNRLKTIRTGNVDDPLCDVGLPITIKDFQCKYDKIVQDATLMGIDVYRCNSEGYNPTLLIGARVYGNNVITDNKISVPILTLLQFRNINEGIALANNQRQTVAASVWSENVGLVNEVSKKLNVGTVWVNSHGIISPYVSFYLDGKHYGGNKGARENLCLNHKLTKAIKWVNTGSLDLHDVITNAKAKQKCWANLHKNARADVLKKCASILESNKNSLSKTFNYDGIEDWIMKLLNSTQVVSLNDTQINEYDIKSYSEPLGVIVLLTDSLLYHRYVPTMLLHANAVIVLHSEEDSCTKFLKELSKYLPGILYVSDCNETAFDKLKLERDVHVLTTFAIDKNDVRLLKTNLDGTDCTFAVTKIKNIWTDIGESFL